MSKYLAERYQTIEVYTPGEQPQNRRYIKLNTNESPYPPAPAVSDAVRREAGRLELYSDPTCWELRSALARRYGGRAENVFVSNGSDEILSFAFMAFGGCGKKVYFPDISYGFYRVYADLYGYPSSMIPLREDFSIDCSDYVGLDGFIVIANPNAPTGMALKLEQMIRIIESNPDHVVLVDEAYIDFGAESCVRLTDRYENLLVVQTFSKSRSMAGARLGFAIGQESLIRDLEVIKYSTNPYNVNRMTLAAGLASLSDENYTVENCRKIIEVRDTTTQKLTEMGFQVLPSSANFVFARHPGYSGTDLYQKLKEEGVLVRHFNTPRTADFLRITIGTSEQMDVLMNALNRIMEV